MRSPFYSERDAFRFLLVLIVALLMVVLASALGPGWLALVALGLIPGAAAMLWAQLRMRKLRDLELPVKMAPPHVGSATERRVLVVANDTLGEEGLLSELERLADRPDTRVLLLVPALISSASRLTGAVDTILDQTRVRLRTVLDRLGRAPVVAGEVSAAEPLQAIEDAFATFSPDEVIVCTGWDGAAAGLKPQLGSLVRERFAVPVRHLVFDPGSGAREPDRDAEVAYRHQVGEAAARSFGLKALAGAGIAAAVLMSAVALIHSSERQEARAASQAAAAARAVPEARVARQVSLSVIAEYKRGPEGEKHDAFTVTEFTVRVGHPQELRIDNTDTVPHSITAPAAGVNIVVMPGVHTYTLVVKRAGTFLWFCTFACDEWAMAHPGYMSGYITAA